jgi:hypothetical protein
MVGNSSNDFKYLAESVVTIMKLLQKEMDAHRISQDTEFRQFCVEFERHGCPTFLSASCLSYAPSAI